METGKYFSSCSKVDEIAEQAFRRKARRNLIVIVVSAILSVTVAITTLVGTLQFVNSNKSKQNKNFDSTVGLSPSESIQAVCNVTRYNESGYSSMSSALKAASSLNDTKPNRTVDSGVLLLLSLRVVLEEPVQGRFNVITVIQIKTLASLSTAELGNLPATTYLGRPWRNYSTTVIMRSFIGEFSDLSGWIPFEPNTDPPNTIFFGEYKNVRPGWATNGRVRWPGVRPNMTIEQASSFTANSFIDASQWLSQARVVCNATV